MKKLITASITLALSFASFATSTSTFFYNGSNATFNDVLNGEESHTEYRYESRPSTCYRNEISGYTTVCYGAGYHGGYYVPRGRRGGYFNPGISYRRSCFNDPIYSTVPYSCDETIKIPYTVKDFDVVANIKLNVINNSEKSAAETITATLGKNGLISLKANGSKNFLVVLKNKKEEVQTNGSVKSIDASYDVELVDAAALKALEVKDLNASFTAVTFKYGAVDKNSLVATTLKIEKRRLLAKKKNLFDRELSKVEVAASGTNADVKLANLGLDLKKGRYVFTLKNEIKINGKLLNAAQFGGQLVKTIELRKKIK
jgi:hypothetical protein